MDDVVEKARIVARLLNSVIEAVPRGTGTTKSIAYVCEGHGPCGPNVVMVVRSEDEVRRIAKPYLVTRHFPGPHMPEVHPDNVVSVSRLDNLRGRKVAVIFDTDVVAMMAREAVLAITDLAQRIIDMQEEGMKKHDASALLLRNLLENSSCLREENARLRDERDRLQSQLDRIYEHS